MSSKYNKHKFKVGDYVMLRDRVVSNLLICGIKKELINARGIVTSAEGDWEYVRGFKKSFYNCYRIQFDCWSLYYASMKAFKKRTKIPTTRYQVSLWNEKDLKMDFRGKKKATIEAGVFILLCI